MPPPTGIVIVDTNCLKFLESPTERRCVGDSLATADFDVCPTVINAVEAAKNPNLAVRERILAVVDALAGGRGLLPLPQELLRRATEAVRDGHIGFSRPLTSLRLKDRAALTATSCTALQDWSDSLEKRFNALHDSVRPKVQALIKAKPDQARWGAAAAFLEQCWTTPGQQDTLLQGFWEDFGHAGPAPIEKLVAHPTWRKFLDLEGVAVFERVIVHEQPKRVHHADLLQLLYLTLCPRGILVSEDAPLLRAARAIVDGRYSQIQALTWGELRRCL
jgi:hypothetical protein